MAGAARQAPLPIDDLPTGTLEEWLEEVLDTDNVSQMQVDTPVNNVGTVRPRDVQMNANERMNALRRRRNLHTTAMPSIAEVPLRLVTKQTNPRGYPRWDGT